MNLTGLQRAQLTALWIKRGHEGDKEQFIKKVCQAKQLQYTPPRKVTR